ncbi:SDR family oxidoreductase [Stratiformator vulcanicus]|uniref:General stress protein 39 n=1 Tax=Stratiformator vulcanicus TaxID=2527980 RepID=A0A517R6C0_9PLAN|nr:SDR family oxidoreductase [Stratiformator vulcanicus]QDT39420.1 General stress protein 39 [Stratiformator vulcanicus]
MAADPRELYPKPPFKQIEGQDTPGVERKMEPEPIHGESSYVGHGRLEGMAALITGADSGIGRAVAIAFAREGADIVCSYLSEDKDAEKTAAAVREAGRKCLTIAGDIKDQAHCQKLVDRTLEEFDKLDVLVNNAATQVTHEDIGDFTAEEWEDTFRTNIHAMFYLCKAALPRMNPGGSIINTTSIQSYDPSAILLPYAPTKAAITNFTKALCPQAMRRGVRVNGVAPGPVWTPLIPATMPKDKVENFGANTVFERPAQPVELAPLYVFLASAEASYVTGEIYGATGGRSPV